MLAARATSERARPDISTTDAMPVANAIEIRGSFPREQAAPNVISCAIRSRETQSRTVRGWLTAVN
jgi:hypothetical protein